MGGGGKKGGAVSGGNGGSVGVRDGEANTYPWWSLKDRLELSHAFVGTVDAECTFYFGCCGGGGGGRRESQVRDAFNKEREKNLGKGGLTHRSPLKINHYSERRNNSSSAHFRFREREKKRGEGGEAERQGGEGGCGNKEGRKDENEDVPLGHDDRNVTPNVQLSARISGRNLHVRKLQALLQRTTKHDPGRRGHIVESLVSLRERSSRRLAGLLLRRVFLPPREQPWFAAAAAAAIAVVVVVVIAVLGAHPTTLFLLLLLEFGFGFEFERRGRGWGE